MNHPARNSDPSTSHQSAEAVGALAAKLRTRVLALAREAGTLGLTINETEHLIPEHKYNAVSPRFAELIESGALVRQIIGIGKPTKRFPTGRPLYETRYDKQTNRRVLVHWLPEFAPAPKKPAQSATVLKAMRKRA